MQSCSPKDRILGRRDPPVTASPGHQTSTDSAPRPEAAAITRAGWRLRKAEANREMFTASPRMAEIEHQLQYLKKDHAHRVSNKESARPQIRADAKSNLAATGDAHRSESKRKTYGVAVRGASRITYHGNRAPGDRPRPRLAYSDPARELAHLLARGAPIERIAPGHYFRGGQLLVGLLRTLRFVIRSLEIEQQHSGARINPKSPWANFLGSTRKFCLRGYFVEGGRSRKEQGPHCRPL